MIRAQTNNNMLRLGSWSVPTTWKLKSTDEHTTSKSGCLAELGHSQKIKVKEVGCARYILPFRYWAAGGRHCNWRRTQWHKLSLSLSLSLSSVEILNLCTASFKSPNSPPKKSTAPTWFAIRDWTLKDPILLSHPNGICSPDCRDLWSRRSQSGWSHLST